MEKNKENRINTVIENTLKNINNYIDVNTVIGKPILDNNQTIIPITTLTLCVFSGGGEYGKINFFKSSNDLPYSVGNGTIISVKPCAFLVKNSNNDYKLLNVSTDHYEKILDKANEIITNTMKD